MFQKWHSITLWKRVIIGLFLGLTIGLVMRYTLGPSQESRQLLIETTEQPISVDPGSDASTMPGTPLILNLVQRKSIPIGATIGQPQDPEHGQLEKQDDTTLQYTPDAGWTGQEQISYTVSIPYGRGTAIANAWIKPFGDAFIRLIKMLIIPLILTTLVAGVTAMGDPSKLGSLGARTMGMYLATTLFAVTLGLVMGTIIRPGAGNEGALNVSDEALKSVEDKIESASAAGGFVDRLLEIIPTNPIGAMANGDVLPTIFFAIMIGVGILIAGEIAKPVKDFFEAASEVVMRVTILVMELAPYGVLALMAWVMATQGIEVLVNMGKLAIALYLACAIQIFVVYGGMIVKGLLGLPMKQYFRGIADAQGVAFSTASSNATLPVSISCAETNLGVDKSVAGSVLPLGATINMDGTAIYLGLIALFAAQTLGIELSMTNYVMVAMTATLVSIGAAGIPSAGLLLAATVLEVIKVSPEQSLLVIAFIFPFDRLLDMMRTMTNVSGDIAVACTVAKWEGSLDEKVFKTEAEV